MASINISIIIISKDSITTIMYVNLIFFQELSLYYRHLFVGCRVAENEIRGEINLRKY